MKFQIKDNFKTRLIILLILIPLVSLYFFGGLIFDGSDRKPKTRSSYRTEKVKTKNSENDLIKELKSKYVGVEYNTVAEELYEKYGEYETLDGTDNNYWIVYYKKGDFTMIERKGRYVIIDFEKGKKPR